MKKTWWVVQMILVIFPALLIGPFAGVWAMSQIWLEHWRDNYGKENPAGVWSRAKRF